MSPGRWWIVLAKGDIEGSVLYRDRASAVLDRVGGKAEKTGKRFGGMSKAAGLAGAAVGALALKFGKDSVDAFKEAEQSSAALDFALRKFPKTADVTRSSLDKLNMAMSKKTTFDDDAFASGQAVLAQFDLTGQQIRKLTPLLADYATKTGKDLPTAATDLGRAFGGNAKALKALGINYKATGDRAKDQAAITELLTAKVGGAAEAMGDTAAGKAKILENQYGNLQEQVGAKLVPALTRALEIGLKVVDWIDRNQAVVGPLAVGIGSLVVGVKAWTAAQLLLNSALFANPIGLVVLAIAALAVGFAIAWNKSETFRSVVTDAFKTVAGAVLKYVEMMLNVVKFFAKVSDKVFGTNFAPAVEGAINAVNVLQEKLDNLGKKPILIDVRASVLTADDLKTGRRYAHGTMSAARGVALVGEQGPELVRFNGGERVIPAGATKRAMRGGDGGTPVYITVQALDPRSAADAVMAALRKAQRSGTRLDFLKPA